MAHADDELLSALLDGETAEGDAAHVRTCEQCQDRLAGLQAVSEAVAKPVPPVPGHLREAAVRAAVRGVTEMRPRRSAAAQRRMSGLSAAAALVVAFAVGGWAISHIGNGSADKTNANIALSSQADAPKSATPTGGLGAENSAIDSRAGAAGTTSVAAPAYDAGDLGAVDTVARVSQRASSDLSQRPEAIASKSIGAASPCPYASGAPVWQATLLYNGERAVAHLVKVDETRQVMQILRQAGCEVIASQDFAPTTPR